MNKEEQITFDLKSLNQSFKDHQNKNLIKNGSKIKSR